jgi:acetyl-CoA carboxylase biotin carboxyl carrier protein
MELEHIKGLVSLMVENDLSRIEIREGDTHILLRRGQSVVTTVHAVPPPAASAAPPPTPPSAPVAPAPSAPAVTTNETIIRSPMVGTFYTKPDPGSPAFVNVGDAVNPNSVVCLIEAMKVFNEIKAECTGRITRVMVENGKAVEYDQPLFAVAPT